MLFDILSLFPNYFTGPFSESIIKRAKEKGLVDISLTDIREFAANKHKKVDDRPFGGGPGMVMTPEPVVKAIRAVRKENSKVIYLSPQGKILTHQMCQSFARNEHIVLLCGHYEGIDQRAIMKEVDEEVSIGNYVLTSGCPAAIVFVDSVTRFIPGVLGHPDSALEDSFQEGILEGPQYTRPRIFEEMEVPAVLVEGHHEKIAQWRKNQGREKTQKDRPDLCHK